ncbi:MAG TPA: endonuclease [Lachnospiraceae bacterium]|nr:Z1 domain-containing protein [uncultured Lachnoclostridium sp.]HAU86548.1 endonuclease [Lachnospiraceae bacterium]
MSNLDTCENIARMLLKEELKGKNPTEEDIKKILNKVSMVTPMQNVEREYVEKQLQASFKVRMDIGNKVVEESTYHPWLMNKKAKFDFYYWNRYRKYLLLQQGWSEDVIDSLSEVSDEILDLCGDPTEEGGWKRKGLIIGDVQSGKTSNYLALCNKAADAGYKLIILLTGTIEGLRKQTQERVDAGFVGLNSRNVLQKNPEIKYVGVGSIDENRTAYPFTSVLSDFDSAKLQSLNFTIKGMNEPVILVLKKNKSVLENLETWLSTRNTSRVGAKIDLPLLLIDDEADNASINTNKPEHSPTTINKAIVEILRLFTRSSYVAVTATPFANIFIDPDLDQGTDEFNLFPRDFIYALSAPTNYIGIRQIFGSDASYASSIQPIEDVCIDADNGKHAFRSKAKSAHIVTKLPESLKRAVKYFCLVNVVMDLRGNTKTHRSMLINVSQYVNVQNQVFDKIVGYVRKIKNAIQSYSQLGMERALKSKELNELFEVWFEFNMSEKTGYDFNIVLDKMYESVMPIVIRLVNQKAKEKGIERLDYEPYKETGLRVIAVGGNSLSRGLTLEGLSVSYFDRNSQMYDTLMQMGRWFGYRKGYEDLFKIWMEPEAISWYQYITEATIELRNSILEMKKTGLTPAEFGFKVQQNKTALFVTSRNKMRSATPIERVISLAAEVIETPKLIASREKCLKLNLESTNKLLTFLEDNKEYKKEKYNFDKNRIAYTGVEKDIIAKYIRTFVAHPRHIPFSASDLSDYIENSNKHKTWTVAIIGGGGEILEEEYFSNSLVQLGVKYSSRVVRRDENCLQISGKRARVGVPGATKYGLTKTQVKKVEENYRKENSSSKTIPDKPYLSVEREPVLLIYIIKVDKEIKSIVREGKRERTFDSDKESIKLIGDMPVIALGIGFPGTASDSKKVRYIVNKTEERNMFSYEEAIEDENE